MGLKNLAISMALISLFAVAFITFGVKLAIDNNANQSIADDDSVSRYLVATNTNLTDYASDVNASATAYGESEGITEGQTVVSNPVVIATKNIWNAFVGVPHGVYKLTLGLIISKIFGTDVADTTFTVLFSLFSAIMVVVIIIVTYAWFRSGTI